jgi:hypothetical protein
MNQSLYAHINNKTKMKKKKRSTPGGREQTAENIRTLQLKDTEKSPSSWAYVFHSTNI